jgi:hypothetical protein
LGDTIRTIEEYFDVVLIDAPPLLSVADAAVVGTLTNGVLLVVRAGRTRAEQADRAVEILRAVGAHLAGVVLNKGKSRSGSARRRTARTMRPRPPVGRTTPRIAGPSPGYAEDIGAARGTRGPAHSVLRADARDLSTDVGWGKRQVPRG